MRINAGPPFADEIEHHLVDEGTVGFHEVVGEGESIGPVGMEDAERRMQSGGADGSRDDRPKDRAAIVQQGIRAVGVLVA